MKHMKKSMFISTVMMVVLLIVALSTATFAWFSANDTVFATQTTLTAAQSSSANIKIGWQGWDDNLFGSTISFDTASNIEPAIPLFMPSKTVYNSSTQYVATNIEYDSGIAFDYVVDGETTYEGIDYINIVDFDLGTTIPIASVLPGSYDGLQFANEEAVIGPLTSEYLLGRIYRSQHAREAYYLVTDQPVNTELVQVIPFTDYNNNNFLVISASPVAENEITAANAIALADEAGLWDGSFDANLPSDGENFGIKVLEGDLNPGDRIYQIAPIDDIHTVYPIWDIPTNFVPNGVAYEAQNEDFFTMVTALGQLDTEVTVGEDTEYYIHYDQAIVAPYNCVSAVAQDKIYLVREDIERARSIFSVFSNQFYTTTIDQDARFKSNGNTAVTAKLNELGVSEETIFILKNDSGVGSAPAVIDLTVTIPAGAAIRTDLRLAVFVKNAGETNFFYTGTLSANPAAVTYYGSIVHGAYSNAADLDFYLADGLSLSGLVTIEAGTAAEVQVIAWYDGIGLDDAKSGQAANFTLVFSAQG